MGFCINCGTLLAEGAKFCQKCGKAVPNTGSGHMERRPVKYEGRVYKCPNCGEVLHSFVRNCPSCGLELRSAGSNSSIREFALKLEAIEARRDVSHVSSKTGVFDALADSNKISGTDAQKVSLIQSFSVPNTKEDMLEFMILATANVNLMAFDTTEQVSASDKAINNAWISKIKQVYNKAKLSYGSDRDFQQIEALYNRHTEDIRRAKRKIARKWVLVLSPIWIWFVIIPIISFNRAINGPTAAREEIARLEAIENEATAALDDGEYKRALLNAEALIYDPSPKSKDYKENKRQWDIRRELLIDTIIEEAEEHGVVLRQTESAEKTAEKKESNNKGFVAGFVEGFNDALQSGEESESEKP